MPRSSRHILAALALLIAAPVAGAQSSNGDQSITVGNAQPFNSQFRPFFGHIDQTRHQQVYDASYFGDTPFLIRSFTFHQAQDFPGPLEMVPGTYAFRFTTTNKAVGGLSENFEENIGAPLQEFLVTTARQAQGSITFVGSTPFLYDPRMGNLLLDIAMALVPFDPNTQYGRGGVAVADAGSSYVADRRIVVEDPVITSRSAPLTTFGRGTTVPEPGTWALLGTGLLAVGGVAARRKRTTG